jgi:serine/threonine protein kinase
MFTALNVLHSARIPVVHRDVKPANLMLSRSAAVHGEKHFDVNIYTPCVANVCCECVANVCYECVACVLRMCCECVANVLLMCC